MKKWHKRKLKEGVYAVMLDNEIIGMYSDEMIVYPVLDAQKHYVDDLITDGRKRTEVNMNHFCRLMGFPRMTWVD